ncbi:MAG: tRNA uridine-5-carboxymethylaminomethyl(34) synthesis GTPase MnmE [Fimbriimonadaceae bacterium]
MRLGETIVAPITALGGPVAIVRLSGPDSVKIAQSVFHALPAEPQSHRAYYGQFQHGDDGYCIVFEEGRSYTGESSVELFVHGSTASVRALLEGCLLAGGRRAKPGEFTWRAFANGRIDLSQAEAVRDTIESQSDLELRIANLLREGTLRARIADLLAILNRTLGGIEASVDFGEEIGEFDRESGCVSLGEVVTESSRLLETASSGRILRRGFRVALAGLPNAGKSSLLNALLKSNRAIVTQEPGTTRDYLEERAEIQGVPCVLVDTAGLRDATNVAEAEGVIRSREILASADLVLYLYDGSLGLQPEDEVELARLGDPVLVSTKADLSPQAGRLAVSSITGAGLAELQDLIVKRCQFVDCDGIFIKDRHIHPLERAKTSVELAITALQCDLPSDLAVTALREAIHSFGEITGESASEDMIERMFADFCIGK